MARTGGAVLAMLLLIPVLPLVQAQDGGDAGDAGPREMATDATDDVVVVTQEGTSQPDPLTVRPSVDLTAFTMEERATDFVWVLSVTELGADQDSASLQNRYWIDFIEGDDHWRIEVDMNPDSLLAFGQVRQRDPANGNFVIVAGFEPEVDPDAATITAVVEREVFRDENGAPPFPGKTFTDFNVQAYGERIFADGFNINDQQVDGAYLMDRMPDDGVADEEWPIVFGVEQTGHAFLQSHEPYRFSNGEATTFVFDIQAVNLGQEPDRFELSFSSAPADWDVRTPQSTINVEANETVEVPVVVRTVFSHDHGRTQTILMEAQSVSDPASVGRIEFGIHYPEIPQPTGHHDEIWFHSEDFSDSTLGAFGTVFGTAFGQEGDARLFMNAAEDPESDDGVAVQGNRCGFSQNTSGVAITFCWTIELEPGLKLGIDMDMEDIGTIQVPISTVLPMPAATLEGNLEYLAPPEEDEFFFFREGTPVARIEAAPPEDIDAATSRTLSADIVPLEEGDYIEYAPNAGLRLQLRLRTERPDNPLFGPGDLPAVEPGATARLPLDEYEDPVDDVFGGGGAVELFTDEPEKFVNPGEVRLYEVALNNNGPLEDAFKIDLAGSNIEWAQVLTGNTMTISAGDQATVNVAVQAPDGTPDGERADLILEAASATDPNTRALLRLLTTVDTTEDHPDDSEAAEGIAPPAEDTPGLPLIAGVLVLAAAAMVRRRRL